MVTVFVIAEGATEERFIKDMVAPAVRHLNIFVKAKQLNTSTSAQGGAVSFDRLKFHARNHLRSQEKPYVTTLIDLYALDTKFPRFEIAMGRLTMEEKVRVLNEGLHQAIVEHTKCPSNRFIPHIQPFEFEGLLFSSVKDLLSIESNWARFAQPLENIRRQHDTPEHINGGGMTHPSKRLEILQSPKYHKTRHGPMAAQAISLSTIEKECAHFRGWMNKLRALAS